MGCMWVNPISNDFYPCVIFVFTVLTWRTQIKNFINNLIDWTNTSLGRSALLTFVMIMCHAYVF